MSKISGQLLISGQFQDICDISGISGQLGALHLSIFWGKFRLGVGPQTLKGMATSLYH